MPQPRTMTTGRGGGYEQEGVGEWGWMNEREEVEEIKGKQEGEEEEGHNPANSKVACWVHRGRCFKRGQHVLPPVFVLLPPFLFLFEREQYSLPPCSFPFPSAAPICFSFQTGAAAHAPFLFLSNRAAAHAASASFPFEQGQHVMLPCSLSF
jgi:hypothetical protein